MRPSIEGVSLKMPIFHIHDFHRRFRNSELCIQHLFESRFLKAICPKCGRENAYHRHINKQCYTCTCGKHHIYPRTDTIFEKSSIPLTKWFYAIFVMCRTTRRTSAKHLQEKLRVSYTTAWRMIKQIRASMPENGCRGTQSFFETTLRKAMEKRHDP